MPALMIRRRTLLLAAVMTFLGLAGRPSAAQEFRVDCDALDAILDPLERPGQPGGVLLVQRDGERVYERAFGLASVEHGVPNRPSTVFKISYGEAREFTAMAVAMLAADGTLSLDDSVRKHVPELPAFADAITLRHLIHHASGLPDYGALFLLTGWQLYNPLSDREFFELLGRLEGPDFPPGTDYMYSNTDYALLAFVVERASGTSLREVCERELFAPLGMTSTRVNDNYGLVVANRAYDYYPWTDGLFLARREKTSPAGRNGVLTTVEDLARWAAALDDTRSPVGRAAMALREGARFPPGRPGEHVFGHYLRSYRGLDLVCHQGINDSVYLVRIPERRVSIAFLVNGRFSAVHTVNRVIDALFFDTPGPPEGPPGLDADTLGRWQALLARHPHGVDVAPADLQRLAGTYSSLIASRGRDFRAAIADGKLVGEFGDPIVPLGDGVFYYFGAFVEVEPPAEGEPVRLKAYAGDSGQVIEHFELRPPAPAPDPAALALLPGRYHSDVLGVTWTLATRDGQLILERERMPETVLELTAQDTYALAVMADAEAYVFDMTVTVHRDAQGRPTRLVVSHARIRGLAFDRL